MKCDLNLKEICGLFKQATKVGNCDLSCFSGIASLAEAVQGDVSFLGNPKYKKDVKNCKASLVLVPTDLEEAPQDNQIFIKLEDPSHGLAIICKFIESRIYPAPEPGIHATAFVEDSAKIDISASIGPFCYIGKDARIGAGSQILSHCHIGGAAKIGDQCKIHPGVKVLSRCEIGNRVVLNAGVVIGSEGYGFEQVKGENVKTPHLGIVVIEDDVEIGANTCIDRARFEKSLIGTGTKIDNLVQIGHNVKIGKDCLIVAQVGIAGSVRMEDQVIVGGQAGFAGHLKIGKSARIAGQAGITKDVEPGAFLKGNPALPVQLAHRLSVLQRKLPDLFIRFAQIEGKK